MISERDIYTSANTLIKQHGEDARNHAARRTKELEECGDMDGVAVWKLIIMAMDELLAQKAPKDATLS